MFRKTATFIGIVLSILIPSAVFAYTVGWTYSPTTNSVTQYPSASTNVGIASSTPSAKLDVGGNINLGANNAYQQGDRNILFASTTNSITAGGFGALGLFTSTVSGNNTGETAFGFNALANATSTGHDAAFGYQALASEGAANQTNGIYNNAAFGYGALQGLTTGTNNVGIGSLAMQAAVTGSANVAIGQRALNLLTSGSGNFGLGFKALNDLTTQSNNVAIGGNTAFGFASTVGSITAIGASAAFGLNGGTYSYDGGGNSVFIGDLSGNVIATSTNNDTCIGHQSCINLSNGSENIIIGSTVNTGGSGITTGGNNVIIAPFNPLGTSATVSNFLNLDNIIFGTGIAATSTSTSLPSLTGNVGIATSTPQHGLSVQTDIQDYGGKADFGTGGNTAIVCYLADGTLGHITITSLLASGNCVAN